MTPNIATGLEGSIIAGLCCYSIWILLAPERAIRALVAGVIFGPYFWLPQRDRRYRKLVEFWMRHLWFWKTIAAVNLAGASLMLAFYMWWPQMLGR